MKKLWISKTLKSIISPLRLQSPFRPVQDPLVEAAQKLKMFLPGNKSRYKNIKVNKFGMIFDSKAEYNRWVALQGYLAQGVIKNLERQRTFEIADTRRYIADFVYTMDGVRYIEEVKSPELLKSFIVKKRVIERRYGMKIIMCHPKNVLVHPKLLLEDTLLTRYWGKKAKKEVEKPKEEVEAYIVDSGKEIS